MELLVIPEASEPLILGMNFLIQINTRIICAGLTCPFRVNVESPRMEPQEPHNLHLGVEDQPSQTSQTEVLQTDGIQTTAEEVETMPRHLTVIAISPEDQTGIHGFFAAELGQFSELLTKWNHLHSHISMTLSSLEKV